MRANTASLVAIFVMWRRVLNHVSDHHRGVRIQILTLRRGVDVRFTYRSACPLDLRTRTLSIMQKAKYSVIKKEKKRKLIVFIAA